MNSSYKELIELMEYLDMKADKLKQFLNLYKYLDDIDQNEENFGDYQKLFESKNMELIKLAFKHIDYNDKAYGVYFAFILNNIIKDYQNIPKLKYDAEKTFSLILEVFKELFHKQFEEHFTEFINSQKGPKEKNNKRYFEEKKYKEFLIKIFDHDLIIEKMFSNLPKEALSNEWKQATKIFFDVCYIELDKDVYFLIALPFEKVEKVVLDVPPKSKNNIISPEDLPDLKKVKKSSNDDLLYYYWYDHHPLFKIRKLDDEELLDHKYLKTILRDKWRIFGRTIFYFEFIIYMTFVLCYSLNTWAVYKDYIFPSWLNQLTIFLICLILAYEFIEIACLKFYYFISFNHYFELTNMGLCLAAININDNLNIKSSFYSFSIAYAYLCLIFRSEKTTLFGTYSYAFRRILIKSVRVVPLVLSLFFGFLFSFRLRSRFITNRGDPHDSQEISAFNGTFSLGLIKLSTYFMGNINIDEMGLGLGNIYFFNFFMTDAFIFMMPIFLYNLFIGIAVGEVTDVIKKGQIHLLKVRIDMLLRLFYVFSLFRLFKLNIVRKKQRKMYIWITPKYYKHSPSCRVWYVLYKLYWLFKEKIANRQWKISYKYNLDGSDLI